MGEIADRNQVGTGSPVAQAGTPAKRPPFSELRPERSVSSPRKLHIEFSPFLDVSGCFYSRHFGDDHRVIAAMFCRILPMLEQVWDLFCARCFKLWSPARLKYRASAEMENAVFQFWLYQIWATL